MNKVVQPEKIFIEIDDEITFIAEKVRSSLSDRVILVVPENSILLSSLVSMRLLAKEIVSSAKPCIIITKDSVGLSLSEKANLVTVENPGDVNDEVWERAITSLEKAQREKQQKKNELLEKRHVAKVEQSEEEVKRVEEIVNQKERENINEVTVVESKVISEEKRLEQIEKKRPKRLAPKLHNISDRFFASGGDVTDFSEAKSEVVLDEIRSEGKSITNEIYNETKEEIQSEEVLEPQGHTEDNSKNTGVPVLSNILGIFKKFKLPNIKLGNLSLNKSKLNLKVIIPVGVVLFLVIGTILCTTVFASTTIKVSLKELELSASQEVSGTLNTSQVDPVTLNIPIENLQLDLNESKSLDTTTEKDVGVTKATGKVTMFNKTVTPITVNSGTKVSIKVGSTTYTYLTTALATVPATYSVINGTMWGSREVAVSAENAGTSSNLSNQGTNVLSVNGYASSSLTAIMVTGTSFSGGTSKKAKIVSKADIDKLKKDLTDSLKLRAKDEITTKFSDNYLLLTTDPEFKIISEKPSVAIGGEAASVDYEIVAQATLKGISKTNLTAASKLLAEKKVSELGEIDIKNSTSNYELKGYVNGTATILLTVNAKYYIKLKETELKEKIAGKNMSDAKNALSEVNNLVVDELTIYPTFIPDFLKKVPTGKDKVTFIVTKK
jgi:hypothetical protein